MRTIFGFVTLGVTIAVFLASISRNQSRLVRNERRKALSSLGMNLGAAGFLVCLLGPVIAANLASPKEVNLNYLDLAPYGIAVLYLGYTVSNLALGRLEDDES